MNIVQFHLRGKTRTSTNHTAGSLQMVSTTNKHGMKSLNTIILVPIRFSNTTIAPRLYSYIWKTLYCVMNTDLWNRDMTQAVIRQHLTLNAPVRSQATPCGICGGHRVNGKYFNPSTSVFPYQYRCKHYPHSFVHGHRCYMISEIGSIINNTLENYITNVIYSWSF
jgi:hypothetical protein